MNVSALSARNEVEILNTMILTAWAKIDDVALNCTQIQLSKKHSFRTN